jgi:hypothetical protein
MRARLAAFVIDAHLDAAGNKLAGDTKTGNTATND